MFKGNSVPLNIGVLTLIAVLLIIIGCDKEVFEETPPIPPKFADFKLSFAELPNGENLAQLVYEITFVGEGGEISISTSGDTLNHLWVFFYMDSLVGMTTETPDSIWYHKVALGQTITLANTFFISDTTSTLDCCGMDLSNAPTGLYCHRITMGVGLTAGGWTRELLISDFSLIRRNFITRGLVEEVMLTFDHRTGQFSLFRPSIVAVTGTNSLSMP